MIKTYKQPLSNRFSAGSKKIHVAYKIFFLGVFLSLFTYIYKTSFEQIPRIEVIETSLSPKNWFYRGGIWDNDIELIQIDPQIKSSDLILSKAYINKYYEYLFPILNFIIKNNGKKSALITRGEFKIEEAIVDETPVLQYTFNSDKKSNLILTIRNVGWGSAFDVKLKFLNGIIKDFLRLKRSDITWNGKIDDVIEIKIPREVASDAFFSKKNIDWKKQNSTTKFKYNKNLFIEYIEFKATDFFGEIRYKDVYKNENFERFYYDFPCADEIDHWSSEQSYLRISKDGFKAGTDWCHFLDVSSAAYNVSLSPSIKGESTSFEIMKNIPNDTAFRFTVCLSTNKSATYKLRAYIIKENKKKIDLGTFRIKIIRLKNWPVKNQNIEEGLVIFEDKDDDKIYRLADSPPKAKKMNLSLYVNTNPPIDIIKKILLSKDFEARKAGCRYIAQYPTQERMKLFKKYCTCYYDLRKEAEINQCYIKKGKDFDLEEFALKALDDTNNKVKKQAVIDLNLLQSKKAPSKYINILTQIGRKKGELVKYDYDEQLLAEEIIEGLIDMEYFNARNSIINFFERIKDKNFDIFSDNFEEVMGFLGNQADRIISFLLECKNNGLRYLATKTLYKRIGEEKFLRNYYGFLEDKYSPIRLFVLEKLIRGKYLNYRQKVRLLFDILNSKSRAEKSLAIVLIGELKIKEFTSLLNLYLTKPEYSSHYELIKSLSKLKNNSSIPYLIDLFEKTDSIGKKISVIEALSTFSEDEASNALLNMLAEEYQIKRAAAIFLAKKKISEGFTTLNSFLEHENKKIRANVISDIGENKFNEFINALQKIIEDEKEDTEIRKKAFDSIIKFDYVNFDNLFSVFITTKNRVFKIHVAKFLLEKRNKEAINFIVSEFNEQNLKDTFLIRQLAFTKDNRTLDIIKNIFYTVSTYKKLELIRAIGAIENNTAVEYLIDIFNREHDFLKYPSISYFRNENESYRICISILETLGKMKTKKAVSFLNSLLKSEKDPALRFEVIKNRRKKE